MDSTRRISERGRPAYLTSNQSKVNQTTEAVVSVSEDRSVTGEQRDKVGGVSADRKASLGRYRELLDGKILPTMTQLMGAEEDNVARKALERPDLEVDLNSDTASKTTVGRDTKDTDESISADQSKTDQSTESSQKKSTSGEELSTEDQKEVEKLKQRDSEVRTHEQAHVAAGGQYVRGGITYEYQKGPDGQNYAVGGHVNIDVSDAETPERTIVKMQQVKRAALAPAEPSGADRSVAAAAAQKEQRARSEILKKRQEKAISSRSKVVAQESKAKDSKQVDESSTSTQTVKTVAVENSSSVQEAPKAPKSRDQMNLAREARMRIKRGDSWMG